MASGTIKAVVPKSDIVDNLTTNDSTKVLSAAQGYSLNGKLGKIKNIYLVKKLSISLSAASNAMGGYYGAVTVDSVIGSGKVALSLYATNQQGYPVPCSIDESGTYLMISSNKDIANVYGIATDAY